MTGRKKSSKKDFASGFSRASAHSAFQSGSRRPISAASYRSLPSLAAYLLLSQYRVQAELFLRQPDGTWSLSSYQDPAQTIPLRVIEAELSLAEVYDKVELVR
jgi:Uma2 family endonuclease